MGKVRKLRKKYKALKVAANKVSISKKQIGNAKGAASASKTKKESILNTMDLSKKIFHKPLHHSNKIYLDQCEEQVLKLDDKLVVVQGRAKFKNNTKKKAKDNRPRKQVSKTLQNNLVQDIYAFKKTLNEESFFKNPRTVIMNQTLERLSAEEKTTGKGIFAKQNGN